MTALIYREDDRHITVIDEDDGCPVGSHQRDALCARTRVETLPAADWVDCPDCEGAEGRMDGDEWTACSRCEGAGGWPSTTSEDRGGST